MKRIGLIVALALVGFACADSMGEMLADAGERMQDGSVPDAGAQDEPVTCNMSESVTQDEGMASQSTRTYYWAEFEVDPGVTEVTVCRRGNPAAEYEEARRDICGRSKAPWFRGTSTGHIYCGFSVNYFYADLEDIPRSDPISITVHR